VADNETTRLSSLTAIIIQLQTKRLITSTMLAKQGTSGKNDSTGPNEGRRTTLNRHSQKQWQIGARRKSKIKEKEMFKVR
jgi:hypothetical protein